MWHLSSLIRLGDLIAKIWLLSFGYATDNILLIKAQKNVAQIHAFVRCSKSSFIPKLNERIPSQGKFCSLTFAQTQRTWSEIYWKLHELVEKQRHTKIRFCLPTHLLPFAARSESTSSSALKKKQSRVAVTSKRIPRNGFGKSETTYFNYFKNFKLCQHISFISTLVNMYISTNLNLYLFQSKQINLFQFLKWISLFFLANLYLFQSYFIMIKWLFQPLFQHI